MKKILTILILLFSTVSTFSENILITATQPLYSLTSYLTKGTSIKVHNPFSSDISMTMSRDAIREENFDLSIAKQAQAVINIARIWEEDAIYGKARTNNIRIIEIDASFPYDDKMTPLFFNEYSNGKINPYIWTGSKNLVRMMNIIARDLVKIYPKDKNKINKNIIDFTNRLLELENKANIALVNANTTEVISLSENLQYFLNDLNIFAEYENYDNVNLENVATLMKDKGIFTIVSDRWLKKNIVKAIKEAGGTFVVINTLDIPLDLDGKMDPDAILKTYEENTNNLIKALTK